MGCTCECTSAYRLTPLPECSAGAAATISKKQNKEFSLSAVHHREGWGVFPIFVHKQNKELVILNAKANRSTKYSRDIYVIY